METVKMDAQMKGDLRLNGEMDSRRAFCPD